jgi:hypothetical protein
MRRRERLGHALRLLLIAGLLTSAVLLARSAAFDRGMIDRLSGPVAGLALSDGQNGGLPAGEMVQAVRPRAVLVRSADGETRATAWSGEETAAGFRCFSALLGEALGSAGAPAEIDEAAFRGALAAEGVFLDFFCDLPLDCLAVWLGSEGQGGAAGRARQLWLSPGRQTVQVLYRGSDGAFYRCETAALSAALGMRMQEFQGVSASFAYEEPSLAGAEPYAVLFSVLPDPAAVNGGAVRDGVDTSALRQAVGMNRFVTSSYTEADGTRGFLDEDKSLRLAPDGSVRFRADAAGSGQHALEGLAAAVSAAYSAVLRAADGYSGAAELYLAGVADDGAGHCSLTFNYRLNGIPLRLSAGSAARVTLREGVLTQMSLTLRHYETGDETVHVLPMQLAAAIAAADGAAPELVYADSGEDVACVWEKAG